MEDFEIVGESGNGEYRAVIVPDYSGCVESPREWWNLGSLVGFDRHYDLTDKDDPAADELRDFIEEVEYNTGDDVPLAAIVKHLVRRGSTVILPVFIYEHSGVAIYAGGNLVTSDLTRPADRWDTRFAGLIFDTPERREEAGVAAERVESVLIGEVKVFSRWANGDVWGVRIERKVITETVISSLAGDVLHGGAVEEWETVEDSETWGYIGREHALECIGQELAYYDRKQAA